jgi:nitrogen fixation protein NifU and related proteins
MDNMYRENILDHGMHPRNKGILEPADIDHEESNPLCGDRLRLTARVDENGIIQEIGWDGEGCAISQAAASMLGEEIIGKSLDEVKHITRDHILELLGIPLTINRMKCALLSLKVLVIGSHGLDDWEKIEEED